MKLSGGRNLSPDESESKTRVSIIETVKTPLGFFTLAIIILEGILLAESVTTGRIDPWMPFLLMAMVIVIVFVLAIVKPSAVGVPQEAKQPDRIVVLVFPEDTIVDFHDNSGELYVKPPGGKQTMTVFTPTDNSSGGWYHTLPDSVESTDAIRICVTDTTGQRWRTKSFVPLRIQKNMNQVAADDGGGP